VHNFSYLSLYVAARLGRYHDLGSQWKRLRRRAWIGELDERNMLEAGYTDMLDATSDG
jgi:hypothetical protein